MAGQMAFCAACRRLVFRMERKYKEPTAIFSGSGDACMRCMFVTFTLYTGVYLKLLRAARSMESFMA